MSLVGHGGKILPRPGSGDTGKFVRGDGTWAIPSASAGGYEAGTEGQPVSTDYAWVNQGDATATDGNRNLIMYMPGNATVNFRILKKAAPSAPYSVYLRWHPIATAAATVSYGIILRNSTSGRMLFGGFGSTSATQINIQLQRLASATSINANPTNYAHWAPSKWLKFDVTSTTAELFASTDGYDWTGLATETLATYVEAAGGTVDEIGFGGNCNNGGSYHHVSVFQTTTPS